MCRSGGRRCKGSASSSQATQNARQQRSRARRALRQARGAGDDNAIQQAQQRLDNANAILKRHKENSVSNHDSSHDTARQHGDVTNVVHGENHGYQADVINGGVSFDASTGRVTIGNNRGDDRDVTASHGVHINNSTQSAGRVGSQNDVNHDNVTFTVGSPRNDTAYTQERARYQAERAQYQRERAQYRAERAAQRGASQPPSGGFNVHTGQGASETGGTGPVHITDDNGNTLMQAGNVNGGIWINGKRVG